MVGENISGKREAKYFVSTLLFYKYFASSFSENLACLIYIFVKEEARLLLFFT